MVLNTDLELMSDAFERYLALEAIRLDYMFRETPCVLASFAKIDALKHQIEAVRFMLSQNPVRLMLADDVGLGKTVMTGLLIKELMLRGRISKVLIVVPKSLLFQWQRELKEKFDIDAVAIKSSKDLEKLNLDRLNCVIISIDLLKRRHVLDKFKSVRWDLVVFDEAHNLTVRKEGGEVIKTKRYIAAEKLALLAPNVLLLTATPHHGKFEDFVYRLRLLDPNIPEDRDFVRSIISRYVIRRLREEVTDDFGNRLIPDRQSFTIVINLKEEEYEFYKRVTEYVCKYFNIGFQKRAKRYIFVAYVFQKRASSSIYAIVKTLENRAKRLRELLQLLKTGKLSREELERKLQDLERERKWRELLKYVVLEPTIEGVEAEIQLVESLARQGKELLKKSIDSKFDQLLAILRDIKEREPDRKVIIFTQYRDTLEYLVDKLRRAGFKVTYIHGGLDLSQRVQAEQELRGECDILVATDAASEGLNLQIASVLINYDLPWNPTRIDQRIGRVHRYGQKKTVLIYNLLVNETIDNHVYSVLLRKINEIRETLGKVYDYLGAVVTLKDIRSLIRTFVEKPSELEKEIDRILDARLKRDRVAQLEELIDKNRIRIPEDPRCRPEDIITEEDIESFVLTSIEYLDSKCLKVYRIGDLVYYEIYPPKQLAQIVSNVAKCYVRAGVFRKDYRDKLPRAEYIGLEHPLVQALIAYWKSRAELPILLKAESSRVLGWLVIFRIRAETSDEVLLDLDRKITRKITRERLVALLYDELEGSIREVPLSITKTFASIASPHDSEKFVQEAPIQQLKQYLKSYIDELERSVRNELEIIKQEVDTKYTCEFSMLNEKLRKVKSESVRAEIRRKLSEILDKRDVHIRALENIKVVVHDPEVVAIVRLVPIGYSELRLEDAKRYVEIGKIGEEIVKQFEESRGCHVIDMRDIFVAGFDFISICPDEIKYIEVKTVSHENSRIHITQREWEFMKMSEFERRKYVFSKLPDRERAEYWIKLKDYKLGDYVHLYIVDLTGGEIIDIKNPAANLWKLYERYKREYYKVVIPYTELRKYIDELKGIANRYDIKRIIGS